MANRDERAQPDGDGVNDENRDEPHLRPPDRTMMGGGYAGAQTRGGDGYAMEPDGEIQGASYGRATGDAARTADANETKDSREKESD